MEIDIKLDKNVKETKVIIVTNEINDSIVDIVDKLKNKKNKDKLSAFKNERVYLIDISEIVSIYAENKKVYLKTDSESYVIKSTLYELEQSLENTSFIRISNSEIVNFDYVKYLDFSLTGTIKINLTGYYSTFVSRRYMKKIKEYVNKI